MSLNSVQVSASIGPIYVKQKKREQYPFAHNETCSRIDDVFQSKTKESEHCIYENPLKVSVLPDPKLVISEYREMMREHIERKILSFFKQLIVCHKTKLRFESVGAEDQAESADAIVMNVNGHQIKYVVRQAAHSSGNPCLIAYNNDEWQKFKAGIIPKPQGFVFLKGTDYYRTMNATMNMPKWMNDADREIDEKTKSSLLREKGENLINRSSQGLITPDEGVLEYIQEALGEVRAAKQRLEKEGKHLEVQEVLAYYEQDLTEIQKYIGADPKFLENFLNVKMESVAQDEQAKRTILNLRYKAIRNCQINQSELIQKIKGLQKSILDARRGRKPDHFDAAFKTKIVESARTDEDRRRLEKLLNYSPFSFEVQLGAAANKKYQITQEFFSRDDLRKIDFLARDILQDMRKLRTEEVYERAETTKVLRKMKNWTQRDLGEEIAAIFPSAAASQSTISRIENGAKLVTERIAKEFSRVFQIDPGLFMPGFYYE